MAHFAPGRSFFDLLNGLAETMKKRREHKRNKRILKSIISEKRRIGK